MIAIRRLTATALTVIALVGPTMQAANGSSHDDLQDRRQVIKRDIERIEDALGESSARLIRTNQRLADAQSNLNLARATLRGAHIRLRVARQRDQALQQDLAQAKARLNETRADLATGVTAMQVQQDAVAETVTDIYQGEETQLLAIATYLTSTTTEDLVRRVAANDVIVDNQTRVYDDLRATQVLNEVREQQVEQAAAEVAQRQQDAAANVVELAAAREDARAAAAAVRQTVARHRSEANQAARVRSADLAKLRRVEAREQRIRERIREQARRDKARRDQTRAPHTATPIGGAVLMRPVVGSVTSPYGYRTHPIYKYWGLHDGIDYGAPCGQALYASAGGTVTDSYYSDVYGYRLFVNVGRANGKALTLVYNHANGYNVNEGDRVSRGQVVGTVGDTGWSTGCHLHFTVLANGIPVDPKTWY
ncbi:peptidoglycan DD-metalloendopeptidase family protein [Nocardioides sp. SOB77]|uniref:Peptidoglycan DD-metalloendopeptidase family protein n=1 Tax=Nocardioides oceani TaxID=3058369 RepID=A0ABT8FMQ2_9ACTN|nr:M23 family metallopeptidase [Nocardioides oceani]MDN4175796.1 peptidoglycan DD-metalloendopeptidase family protein [Nocardioides oceani]